MISCLLNSHKHERIFSKVRQSVSSRGQFGMWHIFQPVGGWTALHVSLEEGQIAGVGNYSGRQDSKGY